MKFERSFGEGRIEIEMESVQPTNSAQIFVHGSISSLGMMEIEKLPDGDNGMIAFIIQKKHFERDLLLIEIVDTKAGHLDVQEFWNNCEEFAFSIAKSTGNPVVLNMNGSKYVIRTRVAS